MKDLIRLPVEISRMELMMRICNSLSSGVLIPLMKLNHYKHATDEYTNGLYVIYNQCGEALYVGKVGDGETSVYHRIHAHLNSDSWIDTEGCFRFRQYESLQGEQLAIAERLAIQYFRPPCNDLLTTQDQIDRWSWVL